MALIASPCLGVCTYDAANAYCLGCGRTSSEITEWGTLEPAARDRVWQVLPERAARLGIAVRRMSWEAEEIRAAVVATLDDPEKGAWALGCFGAVAELGAGERGCFDITDEWGRLVARTEGAAVRFDIDQKTRALTVWESADQGQLTHTVLSIARVRLPTPDGTGLTEIGADLDAVDEANTDEVIFDLGLGRPGTRFMLRTGDAALLALLRSLAGSDVASLLRVAGECLIEASPTRVIETPLARAEVTAEIPKPGGRSPAGPHTHLIPEVLAQGRETPPGLDLPEAFAPGAIFHHR